MKRGKLFCRGCIAATNGADRLDYRHDCDCNRYDAFYDATDNELLRMVSADGGDAAASPSRGRRDGGDLDD